MSWFKKSQGFYGQQRGYWSAYWIDPAGKIFDVETTHHQWIWSNKDFLLENYDISIEEWYGERLQDAELGAYQEQRKEYIKNKAREAGIEEAAIQLSEKEEEQISRYAEESARDATDHGIDIDIADWLMQNNWIRVAQRSVLAFEGSESNSNFFDRCEDVLIEKYPDVWKDSHTDIIVNNSRINASDLREAGNLRKAVRISDRGGARYYLHNR